MKMEEDTKIIGWMPICSFVGAVIANIVYRLKKSRSEDKK